jgi:hypothetical protein
MSQQESVFCTLKIKKDEVQWNYQQNNYAVRKQKQDEYAKEFEERFFKVLNLVVELGGVFCMDKYTLDSDYRMFSQNIKIKIPKEFIDRIRQLSEVISLDIDQTQDYNPSPTL